MKKIHFYLLFTCLRSIVIVTIPNQIETLLKILLFDSNKFEKRLKCIYFELSRFFLLQEKQTRCLHTKNHRTTLLFTRGTLQEVLFLSMEV